MLKFGVGKDVCETTWAKKCSSYVAHRSPTVQAKAQDRLLSTQSGFQIFNPLFNNFVP